MRFSLKQLSIFEAVARTGSVSLAAEELAQSQSAASMALAQLERMLGHPLFERQNKRMALTAWGNWLRPKARKILLDIGQIESGFAQQEIISGEINVGVSQTAAEHLFPEVIRDLDRDFPALKINMGVQNTDQVIEGVRSFQYDFGIIEGRCDDNQIQQEIWCYDHLAIVASSNHPYARFKQVSYAQLERAQWVLRERGSGIRSSFESALHGHIEDLDVWREYEQVRVLKKLVAEGLYLSCLPYFDIRDCVKSGELIELNVPELNMKRPLTFIWRRDSQVNPLRECITLQARRLAKELQENS
ncbi:LysR substrate-binding domain-containing protein [Ferrimonas lipolytica]|uniref:LysR family transcriptional regulator n=1 Tax=Ferrimonas lipolytica TaxID=2724191 RepID=A0A6H1UI12_9GAMM|nr:LysR substrate-binding domain-containing protein [Ferrimonas lipolytica]QIZ78269.1 LysR family transcriptional regulator [Ferrimonas lipolytica]